MDKRLNQIQTSTLTESRLNDDFVYWMKTTGLNILLVLLLIGCGYMGWHWWQRTHSHARADAWQKLEHATTPHDLALVASESGKYDSVALLANVRAAGTYLESIMSGRRFDRDAGAEDAKVTAELRREWLDNADQLYLEVIDALKALDTPTALTPMAFHAQMGRAAIAEARGNAAAAQAFIDEAASQASARGFDALAEVARKRRESVQVVALGLELPPASALPAPPAGMGSGTPGMPFPSIPGVNISPTQSNPNLIPTSITPSGQVPPALARPPESDQPAPAPASEPAPEPAPASAPGAP